MSTSNRSAIGACKKVTGGSLLLLAAVSSALAQNSSSTAPSLDGIEEIVVTARKREESLQEIPVAVSAISAAQIERQDLTSFEKIAAVTPQADRRSRGQRLGRADQHARHRQRLDVDRHRAVGRGGDRRRLFGRRPRDL